MSSPKVIQLEQFRAKERSFKDESDSTLSFGGGDGTSSNMDALIDAKIAAAEARTDAKFAAVLSKLDSLTSEVRSARTSIWTAAFAIMGLIVAVVAIVLTIAPAAFSLGTQLRDIARDEVRLAQPTAVTPLISQKPVEPDSLAAAPKAK